MALLEVGEAGLYCPSGNFHIDPTLPVERALITHAHSDHALAGSRAYLTSDAGAALLRARVGDEAVIESLAYGAATRIGDVSVSFHPAGHILGSSQIRIESGGEVWVVSGDYKLAADPTCEPFEPVRCHTFVTESTFGLPDLPDGTMPPRVTAEIERLVARVQSPEGGPRQHLIRRIRSARRAAHPGLAAGPRGAVPWSSPIRWSASTPIYRGQGSRTAARAAGTTDFSQALIVASPASQGSPWLRRFGPASTAFASGWMRIRGARRRRSLDRGFVLSDHADWPALRSAIARSGASTVWVTHGQVAPLVQRGWKNTANRPSPWRWNSARARSPDASSEAWFAPDRRPFAELYAALDQTTKTNGKVEALKRYLAAAEAEDAAWAVNFLIGRRPKRLLESRKLAQWAIEEADVPDWLFAECYHAVGDFAETMALLLPPAAGTSTRPLHEWIGSKPHCFRYATPTTRRAAAGWWRRGAKYGRTA